MISVDGLGVEFSGQTLFEGVSFVVNENDKIALMGKNGTGKSTMMKIMAGEVTAVINMQNRYGGFSPSQWVVGRQPRHGGEQGDDETFHDLNTLEEKLIQLLSSENE